MIKTDIWLKSFLNLILWSVITTQRIYPILTDLEPLLETQESVINDLESVIFRKKSSLDFIEKELERYKDIRDKMKENAKYNLSNPINSFTLIKRMTTDLEFIKNITQECTELKRNDLLKYPSYEGVEEAGRIITRLHLVYRLNVTQLADGVLNTSFSECGHTFTEYFLPMTSSDCFEISKIAKKEDERISHKIRLLWLLEALRIFARGLDYGFNKFDIVLGICECYDALDNSGNYLKWIQKLLNMKPSYNNRILRLKISSHETKLRQNQDIPKTIMVKAINKILIDPKKEIEPCVKGLDRKAFRMLCRGEVSVSREVSKRLKCWYYTGYHPFTKIAPFRAEQLFIRPDVFLFHNALSDSEIDNIKQIAIPQLEISESMSYRLCKGAQIQGHQTADIKVVGQRMSDFTGLLAPVTMMSVSNYGVGGHYVTHVDSMGKLKNDINESKWREVFDEIGEANINFDELVQISKEVFRIATVIFYLSKVEQGGATVFPTLGLTVFPKRGAALFWNNMLPSMDVDYSTCHGACPVLRGSKWVASKWIDAENQELRKPCKAKITSRKIEDIPFPEIKE